MHMHGHSVLTSEMFKIRWGLAKFIRLSEFKHVYRQDYWYTVFDVHKPSIHTLYTEFGASVDVGESGTAQCLRRGMEQGEPSADGHRSQILLSFQSVENCLANSTYVVVV